MTSFSRLGPEDPWRGGSHRLPDRPAVGPMRRVLSALLLSAAVGSGALATAAQARPEARTASVHDCHSWAWYPNVLVSSVRNMSCRSAKRDMRRYRKPIYRRFTTPGGFHCRRVSGGPLGGQWRCVRWSRAYRFEFGD